MRNWVDVWGVVVCMYAELGACLGNGCLHVCGIGCMFGKRFCACMQNWVHVWYHFENLMIVKSLLLKLLVFYHQVKLVLKILLLLLGHSFLLLKLNFHSVLLFLRMPFLLLCVAVFENAISLVVPQPHHI